MRPSASRPPSVSPKPPAIRVTVRARRFSTISCTTWSAPRSAATETIARSAGSGRSASEANARQPSISAAFGWIAQIRSRGTPPPSTRLRRMMRPGFRPSAEAPTTTALRGVSSRRSSATGRAGGRASAGAAARGRRARRGGRRRPPPPGSPRARRGRGRPAERTRPTAPPAARGRTASPASRSSGRPAPRLVRSRPVSAAWTSVPRSARSARLLGEAAGGDHRAGLLGAQGPEQGLGVEPAHPEDDDRAEARGRGGRRPAPRARSRRGSGPARRRARRRSAPGARRPGPRPATRATASRSEPGSLRHTTTPPTSLLWRRSGEAILTTASSEPEGGAQRGVDRRRASATRRWRGTSIPAEASSA